MQMVRIRRRRSPPWRLGADYRVFRSTQLISQDSWTVMPLALGSVIGFFPLALLVFPIGTTATGVWLLRKGRKIESHPPAPEHAR